MALWKQVFGAGGDAGEDTHRFKPYKKGDRVRYPDDTFSGCTVQEVNRRQLPDGGEVSSRTNPIKSVTLSIPYLPKTYHEDVPPGEIENPNKRAPDLRTETDDFDVFWCAPWNRPRRMLAFCWIIVNLLVIGYVVTAISVIVDISKDDTCTFPDHYDKHNKYNKDCADQYYVIYAILWSMAMVLATMVGGTMIFRRSGAKPTKKQRRAEERAPTMQQEYELRMGRVHKYQMLVGFFLGVTMFLAFDFLTLFVVFTHFSGETVGQKTDADDFMSLFAIFLCAMYFIFAMGLWRYRYDLVQDDANSVQADIENLQSLGQLKFKGFQVKEAARGGEELRNYPAKGMYNSTTGREVDKEFQTPRADAI